MNITNHPQRFRSVARQIGFLAVGLVATPLCAMIVVAAGRPSEDRTPAAGSVGAARSGSVATLEAAGRMRCVTGRMAVIAPVPLHQVVEILVDRGAQVKKGDPLVRLDDDEQRAEVRGDEAALDHARAVATEARRFLAAAEKSMQGGGFSEQRFFEARADSLEAEARERSAQAALDASREELGHYTVRAGIDGVVNALDVHLGMVSRPGTTVWGEILDLSEIDAECSVPSEDADRVAVGQSVELVSRDRSHASQLGTVVFVGLTADKETGLIPIVVRFTNADGRLRSGISVLLRFTTPDAH